MNKYFLTRKTKEKAKTWGDTGQPWDKLPQESDAAHEAFTVYRQMGFSRDVEKVALCLYADAWESNLHFVEDWFKRFGWEHRAAKWDAYQDEYHDKIKDRARKDVEMRFVEALPDVAETQIEIALGKKKGDRVQGAMINRVLDQVVPKPQQKPSEVNIWNRVALTAPPLPTEVKQGMLSSADEIDYEELEEKSAGLIPDQLKGKRKQ